MKTLVGVINPLTKVIHPSHHCPFEGINSLRAGIETLFLHPQIRYVFLFLFFFFFRCASVYFFFF